MARRRNIYALRQILAKDVNDQNDFRIADFQHIIRDVIGASSGVVSGLAGSYIGQTVTITAGSITDGETIYELLEDSQLNIPATDATYKIYAKQDITDDLPISGFKLIDIETRAETYDTVNSRTYDSILLGYTTGTIPADSFQIGIVVVSGGVITSYNDARSFITIGNLTSYSLQNFAVNNNNTIDKASYYNSIIGDLTNNYLINVTALNTNPVTLFKINNGTNSSSIAFDTISTGNISYKSLNNADATGFYSLGNSLTNTIGFKANNNKINFSSTLLANTTGFKVDGVNSSDIGIDINNVNKGILITNTSQLVGSFFSKNIEVNGGQLYSDTENDPLIVSSYFASNIYTNIENTGVANVANWKSASTNDEKFVGYMALNNAKDNRGIGFIALSNINNNEMQSANVFDAGFASYFNKTNFRSIQKNDSIGFETELTEDGDSGDYLFTAGFRSTIKNNTTGLVLQNESTGTNSFGIIGVSDNPSKIFKKFIGAVNVETGIELINDNSINNGTGIIIANIKDGINFMGKSSDVGIGLQISTVERAIVIDGFSGGLGAGVDRGVEVINVDEPIKITGNALSGWSSNKSAISLDLNKRQYGIEINNSKGASLQFSNAYGDTALLECDIRFSTHATAPVPHMVCYNPPPVTAYSGQLSGAAALQFYNNGSVYQLKFWDGTAWKTVDVS